MRALATLAFSVAVLAIRVAGESEEYCDENGCYYWETYTSEDCYSSSNGRDNAGEQVNRRGGDSNRHDSDRSQRERRKGDESNTYNYNSNYYGNSGGYDYNEYAPSETQASMSTTTTTQQPTTRRAQRGNSNQKGQLGIGVGGLGNILRLPGEIAGQVLGGGRGGGSGNGEIEFGFNSQASSSGFNSRRASGSSGTGLDLGIRI